MEDGRTYWVLQAAIALPEGIEPEDSADMETLILHGTPMFVVVEQGYTGQLDALGASPPDWNGVPLDAFGDRPRFTIASDPIEADRVRKEDARNRADVMFNGRAAPAAPANIAERLEYLRGEIRAERISMGEIAELQGLADEIAPGDMELLEWAGVPEEEAHARDMASRHGGAERPAT